MDLTPLSDKVTHSKLTSLLLFRLIGMNYIFYLRWCSLLWVHIQVKTKQRTGNFVNGTSDARKVTTSFWLLDSFCVLWNETPWKSLTQMIDSRYKIFLVLNALKSIAELLNSIQYDSQRDGRILRPLVTYWRISPECEAHSCPRIMSRLEIRNAAKQGKSRRTFWNL